MPKICALFTHYNSLKNSLTCIARLLAQTRPPDHILIIDNAGDKLLQERCIPTLHIIPAPRNLGNAGGCAMGLQLAFTQLACDYCWVLDDDSWPCPNSLEQLLLHQTDDKNIAASLLIDPTKTDQLSWPCGIKKWDEQNWRYIQHLSQVPPADSINCKAAWLGALYPKQAWVDVGSPTAELFLRGEDEEYPWKLQEASYRFLLIPQSQLHHPSLLQAPLHYNIARKHYFYERGLQAERQYYKHRNWAWLQRQKGKKRLYILLPLYFICTLRAMIEADELQLRRLLTLIKALYLGARAQLR